MTPQDIAVFIFRCIAGLCPIHPLGFIERMGGREKGADLLQFEALTP
jgi:hypothetical protein